nr:GNAT family protein [Oceanobacillus sp. AG]
MNEVSKKMLEFGFNELNLNRIWASVMSKNKASGKVMQKVGLRYEGTMSLLLVHFKYHCE